MDITSLNALDRILAAKMEQLSISEPVVSISEGTITAIDPSTVDWFCGGTMVGFEHQRRPVHEFTVGINAQISKTVKVQAETVEEAKLKAKQLARELFEKDLLVQPQE